MHRKKISYIKSVNKRKTVSYTKKFVLWYYTKSLLFAIAIILIPKIIKCVYVFKKIATYLQVVYYFCVMRVINSDKQILIIYFY